MVTDREATDQRNIPSRVTQEREEGDTCSCNIIHHETMEKVRKEMPSEEDLYEMAQLFKILGDPTRVRILQALSISEMCVCDIAALLEMTQSAISHQLRLLKQGRLVKYRRDGKVVYYSLNDNHVRLIFDQALSHITEPASFTRF